MPEICLNSNSSPATHALVIGVSNYRHLADGSAPTRGGESIEIGQLTSAARSASEFAAWLFEEYHNPDAPLESLRLLLSPSDGEEINSSVKSRCSPTIDYRATTEAATADLIGFRNACQANTNNVGIVYVAGHGVQLTKTGAILLLEDFASELQPNLLSNALDVTGCQEGLNNSHAANTQFWFVDACRQRPRVAGRFESLAGALTLDVGRGAVETSTMILAAQSRENAISRIGRTSLFNESLLWALRGGAAVAPRNVPEWHVTAPELYAKVKERVSLLASAYQEEQTVDFSGRFGLAPIHRLSEPPAVELQVQVAPSEESVGALLRNGNEIVTEGFVNWPMKMIVQAGLYLLQIEAPDPLERHQSILNLNPPTFETAVRLICGKA